jgi:hypothetical protein
MGAAYGAEVLSSGDYHATVTLDDRPLSGDTDHVVAFARSKTLYVCIQDLTQMVSGKRTRAGQLVSIKSFVGQRNSGTYVFTIGSSAATANGHAVTLTAPVVESYGRVYIPLSFFGSGTVPTHVKISPDGRTGSIILPAN